MQGGPDETRRAGGRRLGGGAWPTGCLLTMPRGPFRDVTEPRRTCKLSTAASARVAGRRAGGRPCCWSTTPPACVVCPSPCKWGRELPRRGDQAPARRARELRPGRSGWPDLTASLQDPPGGRNSGAGPAHPAVLGARAARGHPPTRMSAPRAPHSTTIGVCEEGPGGRARTPGSWRLGTHGINAATRVTPVRDERAPSLTHLPKPRDPRPLGMD